MRVRVTVGNVQIDTNGVDLTKADIKALAKLAASLAQVGESTPAAEEETPTHFGFTAQIERLPQDIPADDIGYYFDE